MFANETCHKCHYSTLDHGCASTTLIGQLWTAFLHSRISNTLKKKHFKCPQIALFLMNLRPPHPQLVVDLKNLKPSKEHEMLMMEYSIPEDPAPDS